MSSTELPRPISFDEIRVGDTVEGMTQGLGGIITRHRLIVKGRDRAVIYPLENLRHGIRDGSSYTWELLDRPVKRGPQYSAVAGDRFVDPTGAICVRTDQDDEPDFPMFMIATGDQRGYFVSDTSKVDALVPFSPPSVDAELERFRRNVIEAARVLCEKPVVYGTLAEAVRALRDHQAGAS